MNYKEALEYIEKLNIRGIKPGLSEVEKLDKIVGSPSESLSFVHVAGTNAKGSVSTYITSILAASGYKVGTFMSPAVFDEREIISINGKPISKPKFAHYVTKIGEAIINEPDLQPTVFEFQTVLAYLCFKGEGCDIAVVECGMGGEGDATNIIKNTKVCVFTPIDMDHSAFLGDTVEKIAAQKSGIMKKGSICVSARQLSEVCTVLDNRNEREGLSGVTYVDKDAVSKVKLYTSKSTFTYKHHKDVCITLLGRNQIENAALAMEACDALLTLGYDKIKESSVKKGLEKAFLPGRFNIIAQKPYVVLDGGHNPAAAKCLCDNIDTYFADKKIIFILSMLKDKDYDKVVKMTCERACHVITVTGPNKARALSALELSKSVMEVNNITTAADSIHEAVEMAYLLSDKDTVVIAWGSFTHLNEVKECVSVYFKKK